jgi:hypothetical protein
MIAVNTLRVAGAGTAWCNGCDWERYTSPACDLPKLRDLARKHAAEHAHTAAVETTTHWEYEACS